MKALLFTILFLTFSFNVSSQNKQSKLIASCETRGCSGNDYCSACKNCSGCKHCAKQGGTCGVCSPPSKAKRAKTSKAKRR